MPWQEQRTKDNYDPGDLRARAWNDRVPPPRSPVERAKAKGYRHVNPSMGALMPQSLMPVGEHSGTGKDGRDCQKTMERLPKADLRRYWNHLSRMGPDVWPEWAPVLDYIERCCQELTEES